MVLHDGINLPTPEELAREEIPLTFNYFVSSAMWLGKYCDTQCKEFMLCRTEEADPRKCLKEGNDVTDCGLEFFRKVKNTCKDELEWYTTCLDYSGHIAAFRRCRREQALFDTCMYENGFERARFGHFQVVRVHDPERPRPKPHVPLFTDAVPAFDSYSEKAQEKGPRGLGAIPKGMWASIFGR